MARTQQQIFNQLVTNYVASAAAAGITIDQTQWSAYNIQRLLMWTVAGGIAIFEQLFDVFKSDAEAIINIAAPQTGAWFQAQMFKFQFDATTPQIVQLNTTTFAPYYPTVDTTKQIIKYCSVVAGGLGTVTIKAAKQVAGLPAQLDPTALSELDAAQSYVNEIASPGITYVVQSKLPDRLYIKAEIFYKGQYSAIIQSSVIAALTAYMAAIPFDGIVKVSAIEDAIQAVAGVNDVRIEKIECRPQAISLGSGTLLVNSFTELQRKYSMLAGYIIQEDTAANTFADTLTFTSE